MKNSLGVVSRFLLEPLLVTWKRQAWGIHKACLHLTECHNLGSGDGAILWGWGIILISASLLAGLLCHLRVLSSRSQQFQVGLWMLKLRNYQRIPCICIFITNHTALTHCLSQTNPKNCFYDCCATSQMISRNLVFLFAPVRSAAWTLALFCLVVCWGH